MNAVLCLKFFSRFLVIAASVVAMEGFNDAAFGQTAGRSTTPTSAPAIQGAAMTRKIEALSLIYDDVESKPVGSAERTTFLHEFMTKSREVLSEIPADHPKSGAVWTLRARCAIELDHQREAWEAGEAMIKLGLGNSDNPAVSKTLTWLERKGLLDSASPQVKQFSADREVLREAQRASNPTDALKADQILTDLLSRAPDYDDAQVEKDKISPWVEKLRSAESLAKATATARRWEGTWVETVKTHDERQDCDRVIELKVEVNGTDPLKPTVSWTDNYQGEGHGATFTSKSRVKMSVPGTLSVSGFRTDLSVPEDTFSEFGPDELAKLTIVDAAIDGDDLTITYKSDQRAEKRSLYFHFKNENEIGPRDSLPFFYPLGSVHEYELSKGQLRVLRNGDDTSGVLSRKAN